MLYDALEICSSSLGQTYGQSLRNQPHGRAHAQGHNPVLLLRGGKAESPLSQHALLKIANKPIHHLLQFYESSRAAG